MSSNVPLAHNMRRHQLLLRKCVQGNRDPSLCSSEDDLLDIQLHYKSLSFRNKCCHRRPSCTSSLCTRSQSHWSPTYACLGNHVSCTCRLQHNNGDNQLRCKRNLCNISPLPSPSSSSQTGSHNSNTCLPQHSNCVSQVGHRRHCGMKSEELCVSAQSQAGTTNCCRGQ